MSADKSQSRSRSHHQDLERTKLNASNKRSFDFLLTSAPSKFTFQKPYTQNFWIPENIIFYISKNPTTPKVWEKLVQTCKYFFSKTPVVVVDGLFWNKDDDDNYDEEDDSENEHNEKDMDSTDSFEESLVNDTTWISKGKTSIKIDIATIPFKLWIQNGGITQRSYYASPSSAISLFISKTYRCNLTGLFIGSQKISFNEFLFLTNKNMERFCGRNMEITYDNGVAVPLDKIISQFPKVTHFDWGNDDVFDSPTHSFAHPSFSFETANAMTLLPIFENLNNFILTSIPAGYDFNSLWKFIMAQPYLRKEHWCEEWKIHRTSLIHLCFEKDVPKSRSQNVKAFLRESLIAIPMKTRPQLFLDQEPLFQDEYYTAESEEASDDGNTDSDYEY